ncbi:hypothetical protein D7B24_000189 [Verticillium nonalfalfae]|uniref:CFEM domain-containing protein n=1 Tax=Verticillium nonalfalfae TaxID=1051616 RepID=A0A3M9YMX8_9PEZI|nr:uncharacterized protein D7B24_000189 [Verticillium nonalfalfae]RNJ61332.1 hypothetical protein D7B24_000189 [Verticillium nonalfalfae]
MKAAAILSLVSLALGAALEERACAGNNCNRQVTGTRAGLLPLESRRADCSEFQKVVSSRPPRTITKVVWTTSDAEPTDCPADIAERAFAVEERQDAPTATVPAYASSCRDGAAYASACDCFGIPVWTTSPRARITVHPTSEATSCEAYATSTMPACASACWTQGAAAANCDIDDLACQCEYTGFSVMAWAIATCLPEFCNYDTGYAVHDAAYNACGCHDASVGKPTPTH